VQKEQEKRADGDTKPPEKNKRSTNILFILFLVCWLILLYFYGMTKGPG
jgi:preprotein translocase subunit SecG